MPSRLDMSNVVTYSKLHRAVSATDSENWGESDVAPTLNTFDTGDKRATAIAVHLKQDPVSGEVSPALSTMDRGVSVGVVTDGWVRRFTPLECERLMGWPDDWTKYGRDERGDQVVISDSQRGKMIGNGCITPVARWIAECIKEAG